MEDCEAVSCCFVVDLLHGGRSRQHLFRDGIILFKNSVPVIPQKALPYCCAEFHMRIFLHLPVNLFEIADAEIQPVPGQHMGGHRPAFGPVSVDSREVEGLCLCQKIVYFLDRVHFTLAPFRVV